MIGMTHKRISLFAALAAAAFLSVPGWGQVGAASNAQGTRAELSQIFRRYPPQLRDVLSLDPTLLASQSYLAPYPDLAAFVAAHPEIARNPSFYIGDPPNQAEAQFQGHFTEADAWRDSVEGLETLVGVCVGFVVVAWLLRALMEYRRWNRLNKAQIEVHTRVMERLTGNQELLAYIQSPAGSKFLETSPMALDLGLRGAGSPTGRILWTVQAGVILAAAGGGLLVVAAKTANQTSEANQAIGTFAIALGIGFVISAIISFVISRRLGLIAMPARRLE